MGHVDRFFAGVGEAGRLRAENEALRNQLRASSLYFDRIEALDKRVIDLRDKLGLNTMGRSKLPADIIHYVPYDNRITLNKGKRDGVAPNLAVVTADGLLAVISTVDETTSQAALITSTGVSIGALALGSSPIAGMVKGQRNDRLVMDVYENVTVSPGTTVITTGYSEFIPRGLKIGVVAEFFNDREYGIRRAFVVPSSRIGMSQEVLILR
jgi:rod shape-determining protein MreC